jgi:hypothetical protein
MWTRLGLHAHHLLLPACGTHALNPRIQCRFQECQGCELRPSSSELQGHDAARVWLFRLPRQQLLMFLPQQLLWERPAAPASDLHVGECQKAPLHALYDCNSLHMRRMRGSCPS